MGKNKKMSLKDFMGNDGPSSTMNLPSGPKERGSDDGSFRRDYGRNNDRLAGGDRGGSGVGGNDRYRSGGGFGRDDAPGRGDGESTWRRGGGGGGGFSGGRSDRGGYGSGGGMGMGDRGGGRNRDDDFGRGDGGDNWRRGGGGMSGAGASLCISDC